MDHALPLMTSPAELGLLLSFPPLNQRIGATFDHNPTVLAILRYYCFITQNIDHLQLNLERHDIERTDLFEHLMGNDAFQNNIQPLIEEYRQRSRRNEPYDQRPEPPRTPSDPRSEEPSLSDVPVSPKDIPLPTSNESSDPSIPATVPIHDHTSSSLSSFDENDSLNESLDYYTVPTNPHERANEPVHTQSVTSDSPLGSQEHPIDVDDILEVPMPNIVPDDPSLDGFLHYLRHEVQIICGKCKRTGHTRPQCIWSREIICNRCEQQGHSERSCNADMHINRARFGRQSPPWLVIERPHEWKYEPDALTMLATTH